jgi:hypothetical protein
MNLNLNTADKTVITLIAFGAAMTVVGLYDLVVTNKRKLEAVEQQALTLEKPRTGLDGEFAAGVRWGLIAKSLKPDEDSVTTLTKLAAYLRFGMESWAQTNGYTTNVTIFYQDSTGNYTARWPTNR